PPAQPGASRPLPPRKPASQEGALHTLQARMPLEEYTPPPMESFNWIRLLLIALLCVTLLTGAAYFYLRVTAEGQYLLASWGMEASGDAYATLGRQKILEGAIVQAIRALEIAQSKDPNNLEILMDLGAAYEANNRLDRAELS
ncbi:MAG TPA: tetratricopeptide repeat protein, partial [Clostridia bacterium]|nr:tetratricopeptide repeat protein [Clostridia bacterium]